jgi:predicted phage tail protein
MNIFGAGGGGGGKGKGGGGGGGGSETKDNLDSTSYAKIIELLSEGEIEGFATPSKLGLVQGTTAYDNASLKDMFLDNTPILNPSASNTEPGSTDFNFKGVTVATRFGTQLQGYVPGFDAIENEVGVSADVVKATPVVRTITDTDVDAVRITIDVPTLQRITDAGDIVGSEIDLEIAVQYNGGGYATVISDRIAGRTGDLYQRDYVVTLDTIRSTLTGTYSQVNTTVTVTTSTDHGLSAGAAFFANITSGTAVSGTRKVLNVISPTVLTYAATTSLTASGTLQLNDSFPIDIKVTRVTNDSTSAKLSNTFRWSSYTELVYEKLRYPNSAYVALRIDAEQFSRIPSRSYRIRGIKIAIPSNATVDINTGRLIYSGVWNGTFSAAQWTTDPAWILYDLLTATRYGLGDHVKEANLDKWAFYRASQYCSELVNTGLNNPLTEPRFSCNVNIQTAEEAYKLINDLCSVFRAMPFWSVGSLTVTQDRQSDAIALFSPANVIGGNFTYEGSSIKTRGTVAIVSWLNMELRDIDREVVEDTEMIAKYGVVTKEVSAFACTSRAQAHRIGKWLLYSERYETDVVSFTTGIENGVVLRPGSIIEIADPVKSGQRRAGRISSATAASITVDNIGDVTAGTLSVVLPDGVVESRAISGAPAGNVINVSPAFSAVPNSGSVWMCDGDNVAPTKWRVLGVQEQEGMNFAVSAISYNESKYAFIESGAPLEARSISALNELPSQPTNLSSEELLYDLNGRIAAKILLTWQQVRGVNEYFVRWRGDFTNWSELRVYGPSYEILDAAPGTYNIEVQSVSTSKILYSIPTTITVYVTGVGLPPSDVAGVSLVPINESNAIIQWNLATDLDVLVGGEVLIRHDPRDIDTAEWSTSNAIVQSAAGNQTQKQVPLLDGTYFVAFRDQAGVRSENPVAISAVLPTPQPRLVLKTWTENPSFTGEGENLNLNLPPMLLLLEDEYAMLDEEGDPLLQESLNGYAGLFLDPTIASTGSYVYAEELNLTQIYDVNIRRRIVSSPITISGITFDDVSGNFDDQPGDFDGGSLDVVNAITYVRTTNDSLSDNFLLEDGDDLLLEDGTFLFMDPTWGDWNEYVNAIVRGRGIQLKVEGSTLSSQVGLVVSELGAVAELQQRVESGSGTGNSTYTVTFTDAFYQTPEIVISSSNMVSGDYYTLSSASRTGFTVAFKNSSNVAVTRSFAYTATGYGKEI